MSTVAEHTGFSVDRSRNAIVFTRQLAAAPAEAFSAWTDPEQLSVWWDPTGERLTLCEVDLRVGGSFSLGTRAHSEQPFTGTYREISRPNLLVFESFGAEGRVEFDAQGDGSLMTVEIICSSPEHLEQFANMGVAEGTSQTLDNLVTHLSR